MHANLKPEAAPASSPAGQAAESEASSAAIQIAERHLGAIMTELERKDTSMMMNVEAVVRLGWLYLISSCAPSCEAAESATSKEPAEDEM